MTNYSGTKCPKCENTSFEVVTEKPTNSNFDLMFCRCSSCRTVIGVLESQNVNINIHKLATALHIDLSKIIIY